MSDVSISDLVGRIKERIALSSDTTSEPYVPDILEFCFSKRYLNLREAGVADLYPMQKVILKCFYRGSRGNEKLRLTKEETQLLFENKMQSVLDKYNTEAIFRELVLVLGRRSGKDFLTSIIALYECMKLIECPTGSPFGYFGIAPGNPIYIITVATSSDQARILFLEMKTKMQTSEYFRNRIGKVEADRIWLLTPEDKQNNQKLVEAGLGNSQTPGTVCIFSGHSNSESLLGKRVYCLLLDEVASFKSTGGATSGDRIYSALAPATADFMLPGQSYIDPYDQEQKPQPLRDSKIISISSPRAEEGVLFELWSNANESYRRLAFKLPTWKVSPKFAEQNLRNEFKFMSPNEFQMEFGAEFSGTAGEKFIPDHYIDTARELGAELGLKQRITGIPGQIYYAHLDPASTSHNYALVVVHTEERMRIREDEHGVPKKEKFKLFVIDHLKIWQPTPDKSISVNEVDEYVINLARRFRLALVTFDDWNSWSSMQKLRSKGIPTKITPFRKAYKVQIYTNLEHLLINKQLAIPHVGSVADMLCAELRYLKRKYSMQGFKIEPDPEAAITTDDLCDALAGACGIVSDTLYAGYPKGATVHMPQAREGGQQWNIGSGQYPQQQWNFIHEKFGKL